jgi:hypothetical protein
MQVLANFIWVSAISVTVRTVHMRATFVRHSLASFWLAWIVNTNNIGIEAPKTRMRRRC